MNYSTIIIIVNVQNFSFEELKKKFHDPVYQSKLGKKIS